VRRTAWLVALSAFLLACGNVGPEDGRLTDLQRHEARWDALGPRSYVYAVERLCFCGEDYRGPVRVRVQEGVAVERVYVGSGLAVPAQRRFPWWTASSTSSAPPLMPMLR